MKVIGEFRVSFKGVSNTTGEVDDPNHQYVFLVYDNGDIVPDVNGKHNTKLFFEYLQENNLYNVKYLPTNWSKDYTTRY